MNAIPSLKFYEQVSQKIILFSILTIMNDQVQKVTIQKTPVTTLIQESFKNKGRTFNIEDANFKCCFKIEKLY